jgi:hypothetical protein
LHGFAPVHFEFVTAERQPLPNKQTEPAEKGRRKSLLGRMPDGMSHDPAAILCHGLVVTSLKFLQPRLADIQGHFQVILGDVAQVIGDRPAHIQFGVVLEHFEQRQRKIRIGLELRQPHGPGQRGRVPSLTRRRTWALSSLAQRFRTLRHQERCWMRNGLMLNSAVKRFVIS